MRKMHALFHDCHYGTKKLKRCFNLLERRVNEINSTLVIGQRKGHLKAEGLEFHSSFQVAGYTLA